MSHVGCLIDSFFALAQHLEQADLKPVLDLARSANVEIMTHTWNRPEYDLDERCLPAPFPRDRNSQLCRAVSLKRKNKFHNNHADNSPLSPGKSEMTQTIPHITVCIRTFKRPRLLKCCWMSQAGQQTDGLFSYSIVVADYDSGESARQVVAEFAG